MSWKKGGPDREGSDGHAVLHSRSSCLSNEILLKRGKLCAELVEDMTRLGEQTATRQHLQRDAKPHQAHRAEPGGCVRQGMGYVRKPLTVARSMGGYRPTEASVC